MNITQFCKKAIGVPFIPHGRVWEGWDCWGLLCIAYKELFDVELPHYKNDHDVVKHRDAIARLYKEQKEEEWEQVKEAQMGDALLIYMYGRACHVGLVVDEEKFLHVEHGINTCLQKMKDFRIEGIYRYVGK